MCCFPVPPCVPVTDHHLPRFCQYFLLISCPVHPLSQCPILCPSSCLIPNRVDLSLIMNPSNSLASQMDNIGCSVAFAFAFAVAFRLCLCLSPFAFRLSPFAFRLFASFILDFVFACVCLFLPFLPFCPSALLPSPLPFRNCLTLANSSSCVVLPS